MPISIDLELKTRLRKAKCNLNRIAKKTPFLEDSSSEFIIHCCHHKVGTVWFSRILQGIAIEYGLYFQNCKQNELNIDTDIFLQSHSAVDFSKLPACLGSHMIRDPRDVSISAYFYHLWTAEEWAHIPQERFEGMSYQKFLNSQTQEQGLVTEMKRIRNSALQEMLDWNYDRQDFIEIKYEDIIANEVDVFGKIFKHYGFTNSAIESGLKIVEKFSFKNAKKKKNDSKKKSHLRSGRSGEWKEVFSEYQKNQCKQIMGDVLIKLGYESDYDW